MSKSKVLHLSFEMSSEIANHVMPLFCSGLSVGDFADLCFKLSHNNCECYFDRKDDLDVL